MTEKYSNCTTVENFIISDITALKPSHLSGESLMENSVIGFRFAINISVSFITTLFN